LFGLCVKSSKSGSGQNFVHLVDLDLEHILSNVAL